MEGSTVHVYAYVHAYNFPLPAFHPDQSKRTGWYCWCCVFVCVLYSLCCSAWLVVCVCACIHWTTVCGHAVGNFCSASLPTGPVSMALCQPRLYQATSISISLQFCMQLSLRGCRKQTVCFLGLMHMPSWPGQTSGIRGEFVQEEKKRKAGGAGTRQKLQQSWPYKWHR